MLGMNVSVFKTKMEVPEQEIGEEVTEDVTIDLSKQGLKKIEPASNDIKSAVSLILDQNELQKLENLELYSELKRFSAAKNQLTRMYGVSQLVNLTLLDLSNNRIVCIEGLKDLRQLQHLNLAGNKIKTIDHLNSNTDLEYMDLSDNLITLISDISYLGKLKELLLHNNRLTHLRQCEKNLPESLESLVLSSNNILDLNEVSHLANLTDLKELALKGNPCLEAPGERMGFNYRPFVKNWCSSVNVLDGYPLDEIESLRAEWLYSQGRGRSFRAGEHAALVEYLTTVCPKTPGRTESEEERKLRLILSKAQLHQQELRQQVMSGSVILPVRQKLPLNKKMAGLAERMVSSCQESLARDSLRGSPDLMTRSLDAAMLRNSPPPPPNNHMSPDTTNHSPLQAATMLVPVPESLTSPDVVRPLHPLLAPTPRRPHPMATPSPRSTPESKRRIPGVLRPRNVNSPSPQPTRKAVPRAEHTASPKLGRSASASAIPSPKKIPQLTSRDAVRRNFSNDKETSEEEDSEMSASKLHAIQQRANQKRHRKQHNDSNKIEHSRIGEKRESDEKENVKRGKRGNEEKNTDLWRAAVCIQRRWRGYRTRHLNADVVMAYKDIQTNRIQDYIIKVANDMEATKAALEGNRKLQVLQMQAINALWKKMATMGGPGGQSGEGVSGDTIQGLAATCGTLNRQVTQLQNMMEKVAQHGGATADSIAVATQTEIVAVHTPGGDGKERFPYHAGSEKHERLERPCNLAISQPGPEQVEQYATTLATDVLKKLSSGPDDSGSDSNDVVMALDSNSNIQESLTRVEPICLTPACQEGKDLRESVTVSTREEGGSTTAPDRGTSTADSTPKESTSVTEDFHNGCPSS